MKLVSNKIIYLASYKMAEFPGIHNKIEETLSAATSTGYDTYNIQKYYKTPLKKIFLFKLLINTDAKLIFFRSNGWANVLFTPAFLICKLQRKKVFLEMPTPRKASINEKLRKTKKIRNRFTYTLLHYISGPWAYWPVYKILQNGDEAWWFNIGNKKRTIKLGNGIDINRYNLRNNKTKWPDDNLYLIGVSRVSFYNGYDRVIKAIKLWNEKDNNFKVIFRIIGDGPELPRLKQLTDQLNIKRYIIFEGFKDPSELMQYYEISHLAVSSLGIHRWGLKEASVLKAREYCLIGIPFIASGMDIDFPNEVPFRFEIDGSDNFDGLLEVFESFKNRRETFNDREIRQYAIDHLSYQAKLNKII